MNETVRRCLDDLASRIDEDQEAAQRDAWRLFLDDELGSGVFDPPRREPRPALADWPEVHVNDALHDPDLMLLKQFGGVSSILAGGGSETLGVRCNYGVSIMPSQYGCDVIEMPRSQGDLPTTVPLGESAIDGLLDAGVPDLRNGQGGDVFDMAARFLEAFEQYPVLGRWIELYHPDTQGPMDIVELIWGSEVFLAFYDDPDRVHAFLDLVTEHYIAFLKSWFERTPDYGPYRNHWTLRHRGPVLLRADSLMNLSPDIFTDFIRDREERCLVELGGGAIHFCGRGDHFIEAMGTMQGLHAINMSQPHLNDMDRVYAHTVDRGVKLVGFDRGAAQAAGRDLCGRVHVVP